MLNSRYGSKWVYETQYLLCSGLVALCGYLGFENNGLDYPWSNGMLKSHIQQQKTVVILYTNYKGETAERNIIPQSLRFASTEWHPEPQWLLDAFDLDRQAKRSFALKDVSLWNNQEGRDVSSRPRIEGTA